MVLKLLLVTIRYSSLGDPQFQVSSRQDGRSTDVNQATGNPLPVVIIYES